MPQRSVCAPARKATRAHDMKGLEVAKGIMMEMGANCFCGFSLSNMYARVVTNIPRRRRSNPSSFGDCHSIASQLVRWKFCYITRVYTINNIDIMINLQVLSSTAIIMKEFIHFDLHYQGTPVASSEHQGAIGNKTS